MKVWITKYALFSGIREIEAEDRGRGLISDAPMNPRFISHYSGREWHCTEAAAKVRAEEMRVAKIASLRKQIAKLEKLTF